MNFSSEILDLKFNLNLDSAVNEVNEEIQRTLICPKIYMNEATAHLR